MPTRAVVPAPEWSMHPKLHKQVLSLLRQDRLLFKFYNSDESDTSIEEYDTNVMGRFVCDNRACFSKGWPSMKIAITIRMYSGRRYNARTYHQRCEGCNSLGRLVLDQTAYAERVAYRIKKWCGIEMERPFYRAGQSKRPHQNSLCEGCRNGHCKQQVWP